MTTYDKFHQNTRKGAVRIAVTLVFAVILFTVPYLPHTHAYATGGQYATCSYRHSTTDEWGTFLEPSLICSHEASNSALILTCQKALGFLNTSILSPERIKYRPGFAKPTQRNVNSEYRLPNTDIDFAMIESRSLHDQALKTINNGQSIVYQNSPHLRSHTMHFKSANLGTEAYAKRCFPQGAKKPKNYSLIAPKTKKQLPQTKISMGPCRYHIPDRHYPPRNTTPMLSCSYAYTIVHLHCNHTVELTHHDKKATKILTYSTPTNKNQKLRVTTHGREIFPPHHRHSRRPKHSHRTAIIASQKLHDDIIQAIIQNTIITYHFSTVHQLETLRPRTNAKSRTTIQKYLQQSAQSKTTPP